MSFRGRGNRRNQRSQFNELSGGMPFPDYVGPIIDWAAKRAELADQKKELFGYLPPLIKNFYVEHPAVTAMTSQEVDECRSNNRKISVVKTDGTPCEDAPNPVRSFKEAWGEFPELLTLLEAKFEKPSPIQMQLWPVLLSGRDAVGIAQTGTGKTLAFLLPGIVNISCQPPVENEVEGDFVGPKLLVLAPTRELAQQIHEEVNKLNYSKIKSVCVYGQGDRRKQIDAIEDGAQVVVATPGRLDDLVRAKSVNLSRVSYIVFDEADRMLDMGFMSNLTFIIANVREDRQFIMTSATWCSDVHYIARNYLHNEVLVRVGEKELEAVYTVDQRVKICEKNEKFDILMEYINTECTANDKGIIFVNRKATCDPLMDDICAHYDYKFTDDMLTPETLYGSMNQEAREESLLNFRNSTARLLICTDVAARGLDVSDVTFVINFDLPGNLEEYVHRSGRTGRAGRTGTVITFVCWEDRRNVHKFIEMLDRAKADIPEDLRRMAKRAVRDQERREAQREENGGGGRGGGFRRGGRGGGFRGGREAW